MMTQFVSAFHFIRAPLDALKHDSNLGYAIYPLTCASAVAAAAIDAIIGVVRVILDANVGKSDAEIEADFVQRVLHFPVQDLTFGIYGLLVFISNRFDWSAAYKETSAFVNRCAKEMKWGQSVALDLQSVIVADLKKKLDEFNKQKNKLSATAPAVADSQYHKDYLTARLRIMACPTPEAVFKNQTYHALSAIVHPDKNRAYGEDANQLFKVVNVAHEYMDIKNPKPVKA